MEMTLGLNGAGDSCVAFLPGSVGMLECIVAPTLKLRNSRILAGKLGLEIADDRFGTHEYL